MFKLSKVNVKKLRNLIRSGDARKAAPLVDFHVRWSEDMPLLFPLGSEASTTNGSDASSDIWDDQIGFKNAINQYNFRSTELQGSLRSADLHQLMRLLKVLLVPLKAAINNSETKLNIPSLTLYGRLEWLQDITPNLCNSNYIIGK